MTPDRSSVSNALVVAAVTWIIAPMGIAATLSMSLLASALLLVIVRVTRAKAGRSHV